MGFGALAVGSLFAGCGGISENPKEEVLQSYLGFLSHGDTFKLQKNILKINLFCR